jgi:SAM-dependent methyltransferase
MDQGHLDPDDAAAAEERAAMREPAAWEVRYGSADAVWSGRVNPTLPRVAAELPVGRAVDVGCGEGGDVVWLAQQGWHATGVDFAAAGLDRARAAARAAGVADHTDWRLADARTWEPDDRWDLVTTHYLHLPPDEMRALVARLATAVAPGGTLLVVGHHPDDVPGGHHHHDDLFTPEQLRPALDADAWDITTEVAERTGTGHGTDVVVRDSVLLARRRG